MTPSLTSPGLTDYTVEPQNHDHVNDSIQTPPQTRFRFKSKKHPAFVSDDLDVQTPKDTKRHRDLSPSPTRRKRHRRHHHHGSDKSYRSQRTSNPTPTSANQDPELDAEVAFRESLFDALADDEGAAFWEGVYGQPIHTYAPPHFMPPVSKYDHMSDDEYAAYVRTKMWEKTHEAVIEERRCREEERARKRAEEKSRKQEVDSERERFAKQVEESLRRGVERKGERVWAEAWKRYIKAWEELVSQPRNDTGEANAPTKEHNHSKLPRIPYPVLSGKLQDLGPSEIEEFFNHGVTADKASTGSGSLRDLLKKERIRWHPDKMQQRFGSRGGLDTASTKAVTAVFQVIDALWAKISE